jgi:hypothetical protein
MDPESKKMIEETFYLAKENNKMLLKIRSVQKWDIFWSLLKWFIIIGIALGSFYYLEPYVNKIITFYGSISGTSQSSGTSGSFQDFVGKVLK